MLSTGCIQCIFGVEFGRQSQYTWHVGFASLYAFVWFVWLVWFVCSSVHALVSSFVVFACLGLCVCARLHQCCVCARNSARIPAGPGRAGMSLGVDSCVSLFNV